MTISYTPLASLSPSLVLRPRVHLHISLQHQPDNQQRVHSVLNELLLLHCSTRNLNNYTPSLQPHISFISCNCSNKTAKPEAKGERMGGCFSKPGSRHESRSGRHSSSRHHGMHRSANAHHHHGVPLGSVRHGHQRGGWDSSHTIVVNAGPRFSTASTMVDY